MLDRLLIWETRTTYCVVREKEMIIGISGPSCSGKTTVARVLRQVLASKTKHNVQILHQDDFYKPEADIPRRPTRAAQVVNWDCPDALEFDKFVHTIASYREHTAFPSDVREDLIKRAKEDQNDVGATGISDNLIKEILSNSKLSIDQDILIVDGFMMYHSKKVLDLLDVAILLRGSFETLKQRRESRSGYVTLEGFWKDPDFYFEDVVWPEFVATHKQLFENEDVEGRIKSDRKVDRPTTTGENSVHHEMMARAMNEAKKSIYMPSAFCVGCVVVKDGKIISTGYSRELPGNTHAEQCALDKLTDPSIATGADLYSTMEPCSVRLSGNLPCVQRIIASKIGRVFQGVEEPADFVKCAGTQLLESAGISVTLVPGFAEEAINVARGQHKKSNIRCASTIDMSLDQSFQFVVDCLLEETTL